MLHKSIMCLRQSPIVQCLRWCSLFAQTAIFEFFSTAAGIGHLYAVQSGVKPPEAKPLKGFGGAGVLELIEDFKGDTYRAVYTVRIAAKVYVLHVFQKKAKHGIATPDHELDLIRERLKRAEILYTGKRKDT
jgi:phage-related protein